MAPPSTGHALQDFKTLPQKSGWKMHRYSSLTFGTEAQMRYPQQLCVCYWMSVTVLLSIGFILPANMILIAKRIRLLTGFHITLVMAWDFARYAMEIRKALQRAKERTDPCIAISSGTERRCACLFLVLLIVPDSLMWNVFVLPSPFMILLMEIAAAILGLPITSWTLMYPLFFLDKNRQDH